MLSPLYSESAIAERVRNIAERLNDEYRDEEVVHIVVTLSGAFIFAADLLRKLKFPIVVHFSGAAPYMGEEQQSQLRVSADDIPASFGNRPVVIIEDIVDSGNTMAKLRQLVVDRFASSIKVVALLKRQGSDSRADYYGFTVPRGLFVVGYGLDLDGRYRELREIHTVGIAASANKQTMC